MHIGFDPLASTWLWLSPKLSKKPIVEWKKSDIGKFSTDPNYASIDPTIWKFASVSKPQTSIPQASFFPSPQNIQDTMSMPKPTTSQNKSTDQPKQWTFARPSDAQKQAVDTTVNFLLADLNTDIKQKSLTIEEMYNLYPEIPQDIAWMLYDDISNWNYTVDQIKQAYPELLQIGTMSNIPVAMTTDDINPFAYAEKWANYLTQKAEDINIPIIEPIAQWVTSSLSFASKWLKDLSTAWSSLVDTAMWGDLYNRTVAEDVFDLTQGTINTAFAYYTPAMSVAFNSAIQSLPVKQQQQLWEIFTKGGEYITKIPWFKQLKEQLPPDRQQELEQELFGAFVWLILGTKNKANIIKNPVKFIQENWSLKAIMRNAQENVLNIPVRKAWQATNVWMQALKPAQAKIQEFMQASQKKVTWEAPKQHKVEKKWVVTTSDRVAQSLFWRDAKNVRTAKENREIFKSFLEWTVTKDDVKEMLMNVVSDEKSVRTKLGTIYDTVYNNPMKVDSANLYDSIESNIIESGINVQDGKVTWYDPTKITLTDAELSAIKSKMSNLYDLKKNPRLLDTKETHNIRKDIYNTSFTEWVMNKRSKALMLISDVINEKYLKQVPWFGVVDKAFKELSDAVSEVSDAVLNKKWEFKGTLKSLLWETKAKKLAVLEKYVPWITNILESLVSYEDMVKAGETAKVWLYEKGKWMLWTLMWAIVWWPTGAIVWGAADIYLANLINDPKNLARFLTKNVEPKTLDKLQRWQKLSKFEETQLKVKFEQEISKTLEDMGKSLPEKVKAKPVKQAKQAPDMIATSKWLVPVQKKGITEINDNAPRKDFAPKWLTAKQKLAKNQSDTTKKTANVLQQKWSLEDKWYKKIWWYWYQENAPKIWDMTEKGKITETTHSWWTTPKRRFKTEWSEKWNTPDDLAIYRKWLQPKQVDKPKTELKNTVDKWLKPKKTDEEIAKSIWVKIDDTMPRDENYKPTKTEQKINRLDKIKKANKKWSYLLKWIQDEYGFHMDDLSIEDTNKLAKALHWNTNIDTQASIIEEIAKKYWNNGVKFSIWQNKQTIENIVKFNRFSKTLKSKFWTDVIIDEWQFTKNMWKKWKQYMKEWSDILWYVKNGKIYINPNKLDWGTLMHEGTHLWYNIAKNNNPLIEKKWKSIVDNINENNIINEFNSRYGDLKKWTDIYYDEFLSFMTEKVYNNQVNKTIAQKIKSFIKDIYNNMRYLLTGKTFIDIDYKKLQNIWIDDFVEMVSRDINSNTIKLTKYELKNSFIWNILTKINEDIPLWWYKSMKWFDDIRFSKVLTDKWKKIWLETWRDELVFNKNEELRKLSSWDGKKFNEELKKYNNNFINDIKNGKYTIQSFSDAYIKNEIAIANRMGRWADIDVNNLWQQLNILKQQHQETLNQRVDYLKDNNTYSEWFKNYILDELVNKVTIDKKVTKRTPQTVTWYPPLDAWVLADYYNNGTKWFWENYPKMLSDYMAKKVAFEQSIKKWDIDGKRIKFDAKTDWKDLSSFVCNTPRCTRSVETARSQLSQWDFYVFATKWSDWQYNIPRIAIRMEWYNIWEVRWVKEWQVLEWDMLPIAKEKYKQFNWYEKYELKEEHTNKTNIIEDKINAWIDLGVDDLKHLYEIDYKIKWYWYNKDPRIENFKKSRDIKKDYANIYWYKIEYIALNLSEFDTKKTKIIIWDADFRDSQIKELGNLESIWWSAYFINSQIESLGNLESIWWNAYFRDSQVKELGNLESIWWDAYFSNSQIEELGNLKSIWWNADFRYSQIESLGNLKSIWWNAYFRDSQVKELGNLESIWWDAYFRDSQIEELGNLESIWWNADFSNSQIEGLGNLESIWWDAYFSNSQIKELGNLESIWWYADFSNSQIEGLGNLESIWWNAYFRDSQIEELGNLKSIWWNAFYNDKILDIGGFRKMLEVNNKWLKQKNKWEWPTAKWLKYKVDGYEHWKTIENAEAERIVWKYFDKGEVGVDFVDNITTPDWANAFGAYHNKMIEFAKNPMKWTPEHEVVHAYIDLFKTNQEKLDILEHVLETRKLEVWGIKKKYWLTDDLTSAEEFLADWFIKYVQWKATFAGKIKTYFENLWSDVKSVFGKEDKVRQLYRDIENMKRPKWLEQKNTTKRFMVEEKNQDLYTEARKYKTAEEFVNKNNTKKSNVNVLSNDWNNKDSLILYHGTDADFQSFDKSYFWKWEWSNKLWKWVYLTTNKSKALEYGNKVINITTDWLNIIDRDAIKHQNTFQDFISNKKIRTQHELNRSTGWDKGMDWKEAFARKGFDWIKYADWEIIVFDTNKLSINSDSQLRKIWEEANKWLKEKNKKWLKHKSK